MANNTIRTDYSNAEVESLVDEFSQKLEQLRVKYEQYFVGAEKMPPTQLRMDVVRIMRTFEQLNVTNTSTKFRIRTYVQKFTSYSTYWNRVLREIEDGTYKRHLAKAQREQARLVERARPGQKAAEDAVNSEVVNDSAREADEFLASLGIASPKKPEPSLMPQVAAIKEVAMPAESASVEEVKPLHERLSELGATSERRSMSGGDRRGLSSSTAMPVPRHVSHSSIVAASVRPAAMIPTMPDQHDKAEVLSAIGANAQRSGGARPTGVGCSSSHNGKAVHRPTMDSCPVSGSSAPDPNMRRNLPKSVQLGTLSSDCNQRISRGVQLGTLSSDNNPRISHTEHSVSMGSVQLGTLSSDSNRRISRAERAVPSVGVSGSMSQRAVPMSGVSGTMSQRPAPAARLEPVAPPQRPVGMTGGVPRLESLAPAQRLEPLAAPQSPVSCSRSALSRPAPSIHGAVSAVPRPGGASPGVSRSMPSINAAAVRKPPQLVPPKKDDDS